MAIDFKGYQYPKEALLHGPNIGVSLPLPII